MSWLELHIELPQHAVEDISDYLFLMGADAVTLQGAADEAVLEPLPQQTPLWETVVLVALFTPQHDVERIVKQITQQHAVKKYSIEPLEDKDWIRAGLADIKPLQVGNKVWIYPSWCEVPANDNVNIILDPGLAFGTGSHPTTALCLRWLETQVKPDDSIIDYGCGSGILAIAAYKLGAKHILAIDHDEQALLATRMNAKLNGVAESALQVNLPTTTLPMVDKLVANILAMPLIELSTQFAQIVKACGHLALSGILVEQIEMIQKMYNPWFDLAPPEQLNEWVLITGIRNNRFAENS